MFLQRLNGALRHEGEAAAIDRRTIPQTFDYLAEDGVAACGIQREMEIAVEIEQRRAVARGGRTFHFGEEQAERGECLQCHARDGQSCRKFFQRFAGDVDVDQFCHRQGGDEGTTVRALFDQAFRFELPQALAHRDDADAEFSGERVLVDARARSEPTGQDGVADVIEDLVADRLDLARAGQGRDAHGRFCSLPVAETAARTRSTYSAESPT